MNAGSCCPVHLHQNFNSDDGKLKKLNKFKVILRFLASYPKGTKTWIRFSSDDQNLPSTSKHFEMSFDSVSAAAMQTVDNYFQMYEK